MRRLVLLTVVVAAFRASLGIAQAGDTGYTAYTRVRAAMHDAPSPVAAVIIRIPKGARVTVASCDSGWCAVGYRVSGGFVLEGLLSTNRDSAIASSSVRQGRGYINSRGQWIPSPIRTSDGKPPAGATAQCRDGTFSFSQSRSGTCSHHGGVERWLP